MPIVSQGFGFLIGYFFERTQRTNELTLLRLSDQLKHTRPSAKTEEKHLVQRIFAGADLPSLVLQACAALGNRAQSRGLARPKRHCP